MKRQWHYRRIVARAGIFLLLGAIVNVAVAWGFALRSRLTVDDEWGFSTGFVVAPYRHPGQAWGPIESDEADAIAEAYRLWPELAPHRPAETYQQFCIQYWSNAGFVIASGVADWDGAERSDTESRDWRQVYRAGWPFLAVAARVLRNGEIRGGAAVPSEWLTGDRDEMFMHWSQPEVQGVLPLTPMPPGFALNTLLYAMLLWAPAAALSRLRRWRRIRIDRCPACAYPMGTNPVCTECGEALPERTAT